MCGVYIELLWSECAHTSFRLGGWWPMLGCECEKDFFDMRIALRQRCPRCVPSENSAQWSKLRSAYSTPTRRSGSTSKEMELTKVRELGLWMSRYQKFRSINDWLHGQALLPIPLDLTCDDFLIDVANITTPEIRVVPQDMIQPDHERCGICHGSLTLNDSDEACLGEGARQLPCGHTYGRNAS